FTRSVQGLFSHNGRTGAPFQFIEDLTLAGKSGTREAVALQSGAEQLSVAPNAGQHQNSKIRILFHHGSDDARTTPYPAAVSSADITRSAGEHPFKVT